MQSRLGISNSQNHTQKIKNMRNALVAFAYVEAILRNHVYRTEKTSHAIIALDHARELALTQIKFEHVEDVASESVG